MHDNCDLCGTGKPAYWYRTRKEVIVQVVDKTWEVCPCCSLFIDTHNRSGLLARVRQFLPADPRTAVKLVASFFQMVLPGKTERTPT